MSPQHGLRCMFEERMLILLQALVCPIEHTATTLRYHVPCVYTGERQGITHTSLVTCCCTSARIDRRLSARRRRPAEHVPLYWWVRLPRPICQHNFDHSSTKSQRQSRIVHGFKHPVVPSKQSTWQVWTLPATGASALPDRHDLDYSCRRAQRAS